MSADDNAPEQARYRWTIQVRRWNTYGQRVESSTPMTVIAATRSEVTEKVRASFEATYDTFREFWSHDWTLERVDEDTPTIRAGTTDHEQRETR